MLFKTLRKLFGKNKENKTELNNGQAQKTLTGRVKFYDPNKKFGFITSEDGIDRFFNEHYLKETTVVSGAQVSFVPSKNNRGPTAKSVKLL